MKKKRRIHSAEFKARVDLPDGQLAAIAAVQTFGDYLVFHPHLHVLAATGLYDREGRFHEIPLEALEPLAELFRHRFIANLLDKKIISERKARQLLNWKHSGFSIDAGDRPVHSAAGRQQLAEYLLRAPFSLEKITWVEMTRRVIYRSSRSWRTKRNFEVFTATEFLAAAVEHIPPKNQHTVRYYGRYSNKCRGMEVQAWQDTGDGDQPPSVPAPAAASARNLRPLWRNLILRIWGEDPLLCPCCKGLMKVHGTLTRPEEIEFFLRLHGMWEGIIDIPPPPEPPYDIETMEPIRVPALFRWAQEEESETLDASHVPWRGESRFSLMEPPLNLSKTQRHAKLGLARSPVWPTAHPIHHTISNARERASTPPPAPDPQPAKSHPGDTKKDRLMSVPALLNCGLLAPALVTKQQDGYPGAIS